MGKNPFGKISTIFLFMLFSVLPTTAQAATTITITSMSMTAPAVVHIDASAVGGEVNNVYAGKSDFMVVGLANGLEGFCVDLFHQIGLGTFSPPLVYKNALLLTDLGGHALSDATVARIGWLANFGFASGDSSVHAQVQGAIWTLEGATVTSNVANYVPGMNALLSLSTAHNVLGKRPSIIVPVDGSSQAFVTPGVPEPASWAMMIAGFGVVGAAARRRYERHRCISDGKDEIGRFRNGAA